MSNRLTILVAITVLLSVIAAPIQAAQYRLDPSHSSMVFKVKHLDIGYVYGMFLNHSGAISYDPAKPDSTTIDLTVQAESVFTNVKKRDNHLRSSDFFNVKQYPEITFSSTSVAAISDTELRVTGDLTLHGVTKQITTDVVLTGSGKDSQGNFRRGFHTTFTVNRIAHGIDFMKNSLSRKIKVILSGEAIRQ